MNIVVEPGLMPVGAKPGQVILILNLSTTLQPQTAIDYLTELGYTPAFKLCAFTTGMQLLAVLKSEQHIQGFDQDYLKEEWQSLCQIYGQKSVRLWTSQPRQTAIAIAS